MRRGTLVCFLVLAAGCGRQQPLAPIATKDPEATPASYTFVLNSADDPRLDRVQGRILASQPSAVAGTIQRPSRGDDPASAWNRLTTELGRAAGLPPPLFARAYALTHVAIDDALTAASHPRHGPLAADAVAAGAASTVLEYLFPNAVGRIHDVVVAEVGSDLDTRDARAWTLGVAVGQLVVDYGKADGSDAAFHGPIPTGPGIWTGTNPVLPMCGTWRCWILTSGNAVQPEAPYPYGSDRDLADVAAVATAAANRTPEQIAIVHKWADLSPPTIWNGMLLERVEDHHLGAIASARAFAFLNVAMYDAFVSCWRCKYAFWTARPFHRIPGLVTVIPTPNFPSYTSGHSTISAAAAVVMGRVFPNERRFFEGQAHEAAMSRLWGGIHFPHDNDQGAIVGRKIGEIVARVMQTGRPESMLAQN